MSRQPRLDVADGVCHVTQRGLERRGIVLDDEDRHDWWRLSDRQATRCSWRVFALALLDNHGESSRRLVVVTSCPLSRPTLGGEG